MLPNTTLHASPRRKARHLATGLLCGLTLLTLPAVHAVSQPVPPCMNFQGRLNNTPPGNAVDLTFSLYDSDTAAGTNKLLWTQSFNAVKVSGGVFSVTFNFTKGYQNGNTLASVFGDPKVTPWLEIQVGTGQPQTPRQSFCSVAYAFYAGTALSALSVPDGSIGLTQLANGLLDFSNISGKVTSSQIQSLDWNKITGIPANLGYWSLSGNTIGTNDFLGTLNGLSLELRTNNHRAMRYDYADNLDFLYRSINVLGGSELNSINPDAVGATIAGGGFDDYSDANGGPNPNAVTDDFGTVSGGAGNIADLYATVVGGLSNRASAFASIGGGAYNGASGFLSTVPGGYNNIAIGQTSFAAGQKAHANHDGSFVWNDTNNAAFASTGNDQFLVHAGGGVGINTNNPAGFALNVNGTEQILGFKMPTGAFANGVLTSNATGTGTWQSVVSLIGPNSLSSSQINSLDWSKITNVPAYLGGGLNNTSNGYYSTIGGGYNNVSSGDGTTVAGGSNNSALNEGDTVGGGDNNTANGGEATVAGGDSNKALGDEATVGGGEFNTAQGDSATISGGQSNTASNNFATVPGGANNVAAGLYSFAAGQQAQANHNGSFVWNDSTNAVFADSGVNQFLIHASGGVGINTSNVGGYALTVPSHNPNLTGAINASHDTGGWAIYGYSDYAGIGVYGYNRAGGRGVTGYSGDGYGVYGESGSGDYGIWSQTKAGGNTAWIHSSDARFKTNVSTLDHALEDILSLRGVNYEWKRGEFPERRFPAGRQTGFIAQEVEKIFPEMVDTDKNGYKGVAYDNIVPVLVEAVKAQQKQIDELKALNTVRVQQIDAQGKEIETLKKQSDRIAELEKQLAAVLTALKQVQNTPDVARK